LSIGRNTVYRPYREEGVALGSKRPRRRKMVVHREARCRPTRPNKAWSLDFVHDQLDNGQKLRALTVVDIFSRESLAIEVGQRLRSEHVVEVLTRLVRQRGAPRYLLPTMAQSSPVTWSISEYITMGRASTSLGLANRPTMRSSRPSTDRFATNT
jgi:transposase InsO family protein